MCLILRNTVNNVENSVYIVLSAFKSRLKTFYKAAMFILSHSWFVCLRKINLVCRNPQLKVSLFCFILKLKAREKFVAVINSFFLVLSLYLRILCIILWLFVVFAFAFSCWKSFISSLVYCTMFFNKHFRSPKIRFRCLLDYLHYP